jgi:hypothetical protein
VAGRKADAKNKRVESTDKIANVLALLLVKDLKQSDGIMQLSRAGFSDEEIGNLLNTTGGTIRQTRYMANKKKPA